MPLKDGTSPGSVTLLLNICNILDITPNSLFIDSFSINNSNVNDTIIPIEKHDIVLKYSKLSNSNQKFIDSAIDHMFDEQTRKR